MKIRLHLMFLFVVAAFFACKKSNPVEPPEEVKELQLVKIIAKQSVVGQPAFAKRVLSFSYDSQNRVVKVIQTFTDLPAGTGGWNDGAFDSYEYDAAGRLVKNSMNRFKDSGSSVVELTQYEEFAYDAQGLVSKATVFSKRQGPPDGAYAFRPTGYTAYRYNDQQQIAERKWYVQVGYDGSNKEVYDLRNIERYQFDAAGNLTKVNSFSVYNGIETQNQETKYNSYDTRKNPFYDRAIVTGNGLVPFILSKNHPLDVTITGYSNLIGLENLVSTRKYSITANGDYISSIKQDDVVKYYVMGAGGAAPTVQTRVEAIEWGFEYRDKP